MKENFRALSRENWTPRADRPNVDELTVGCLQRIADGIERLGEHAATVERQRDHYKRVAEERAGRCRQLERSNAGLRGALTRMKRKGR